MTVPLICLAVLSVVGGWIGVPTVLGGSAHFEHFLEPSLARIPAGFGMQTGSSDPIDVPRPEETENSGEELLFTLIAVLVGASGIGAAYYAYVVKPETGLNFSEKFHGAYVVLLRKYYVNELYDVLFLKSTTAVSRGFLWHVVDETVIDGSANGLADTARAAGGVVRLLQSGLIRSYAAWVVLGAVSALLYMSLLWAK